MYLWLKFLHLFFLVSWFAGLFYLPRIFVNLAMAEYEAEYDRLLLMARKLFRFMTPWGIGALVCGAWLGAEADYWDERWLYGKLAIGLLLAGYHFACGWHVAAFVARRNRRSHRWFRVFNELPVLALLAAVYLAVFKPPF